MRGSAAAVHRILRLLFLLGLAAAAYFALSVFAHAARADDGLTNPLVSADLPASVEKAAGDRVADIAAPRPAERKSSTARIAKHSGDTVRKAVTLKTAPKAVSLKTARKVVPLKAERQKVVDLTRRSAAVPIIGRSPVPAVEKRVVAAMKSGGHKVSTSLAKARVASAVVKAPELTAVRDAPRPSLDRKTPTPSVVGAAPPISAVPYGPRPEEAAHPEPVLLSVSPQVAAPPAMALPGASAESAALVRSAVARHDETGLQSAPVAPGPALPTRPGERSGGAGQVRDSGGGAAPPVGTVPSTWWLDLSATSAPPPSSAHLTGRSVRYSGPPS